MGFVANAVALAVAFFAEATLALALLWRVGSWQVHPAELLTRDEGLRVGSYAKELAGYIGDQEIHISFRQEPAFLVFGSAGCEPCEELLEVAAVHPATRSSRLIVFSDDENLTIPPHLAARWESYRFHDERTARIDWRAPVSPYFHLIDAFGRVAAKGVANKPAHLDRLLSLPPASVRISTLEVVDRSGLPRREIQLTAGKDEE